MYDGSTGGTDSTTATRTSGSGDAEGGADTSTGTVEPTETTADESYAVTMEPVGTVEFDG